MADIDNNGEILSKPKVNKTYVYFSIMKCLHDYESQITMKEIAEKLGMSKQSLNRYVRVLKQENKVYLKGKVWLLTFHYSTQKAQQMAQSITSKQRVSIESGRQEKLTESHAVHINFPIAEGVINDKDWIIKEKLQNWIPKYYKHNAFASMTFKNNNNKSISVFLEKKYIADEEEFEILCNVTREYVPYYFKKQNVLLDKLKTKVLSYHLATQDDNVKDNKKKGTTLSVELDRDRKKIFPADPSQKSKIWADDSPVPCFETNDTTALKNYLLSPERTKKILDLSMNNEDDVNFLKESVKTLQVAFSQQSKLIIEQNKIMKSNNEQIKILIEERKLQLNQPKVEAEDLGKPNYLG